jgi:hypothetical protein
MLPSYCNRVIIVGKEIQLVGLDLTLFKDRT